MGGRGKRFSKAGCDEPKPFMSVKGAPMFRRILENIYFENLDQIFVILPQSQIALARAYAEGLLFAEIIEYIPLVSETRGSAETLLSLDGKIDDEAPFFTINCDQLFRRGIEHLAMSFAISNSDVLIPTFEDSGGSYLMMRCKGSKVECIGRELEGTKAAAGIYFFRNYRSVRISLSTVCRGDITEGEPCVTEALSLMLATGHILETCDISKDFVSLGTPELLIHFNQN